MITKDRLQELFTYSNGSLVWRVSTGRVKAGDIAGTLGSGGYTYIRVDKAQHLAHRLIWLYHNSELPDAEIDHINGARTDNRISNLRNATSAENSKNQKTRKNNSSGIMGVSWVKSASKWRARIKVERKELFLVLYDDFFDACCARKSAEKKYNFHPNHGRA